MAPRPQQSSRETSWLYCRNCGRDPGVDAASADPDWSFCRFCGYKLEPLPAYEYAGFWIRVAAYLIDTAILSAVLIVPLVMIRLAAGAAASTLVNLAVVFAYFSITNGLGGTLGRRALGLRVINDAGTAPGVRTGASLFLFSVLSRLAFGLGYLRMIRDRRKQTWHDLLCGAYVVRKPAEA